MRSKMQMMRNSVTTFGCIQLKLMLLCCYFIRNFLDHVLSSWQHGQESCSVIGGDFYGNASPVINEYFAYYREAQASTVRFPRTDEGIEQIVPNGGWNSRPIVGDANLKSIQR